MSVFKNDFWGTPLTHSGSHKSYRPLCVLSYRLNNWLGGFDPWGYHLTNVVLHALVSAVFTRLASWIFKSFVPTIVAGLLFAAHPIHTEAVAGIVGRADVGACLFFLLCIIFYMKYCEYRHHPDFTTRRWIYLYGSLFWAACSMLTKEHGITVIGVCVVYEVLIFHKVPLKDILIIPFKKRYQTMREGLLHLVATGVILVALRIHLMGSKPPDFAPADNPAADNKSFTTRTLTFLYLPAFNFWLMLYPKWLSFDWSMEAIPLLSSYKDERNIASALFYGSLLIFTLWLLRCYHKRSMSCALYDVEANYFHACHSNGATRSNGAVNRQVCPCLGISQKFALTFPPNNNNNNHHHHHRSRKHGAANGSNGHHSAHSNGHRMSNGNGHYHNGASSSQYLNGDLVQVFIPSANSAFSDPIDILIFSMALFILPFIPATNLFFYVGFVVAERVLYIPSMGFCLLIAKGVDNIYRMQGSKCGKRLVLIVTFVLLLVMSYRTVIRNDDWMDEERLYSSGVPINPPKAYGNLANILSGRGEKIGAERAYKRALSYRPNMADVRYNLGILLQEQGRYEEALHSYRLAIRFRPRLAMAHLNMGLVLGTLGRKEEAAIVYRTCADLDSFGLKDPKMHENTRISALFNLGRLYADDGRYKEALTIYHEATKKMPEHYQPQSLYNMMDDITRTTCMQFQMVTHLQGSTVGEAYTKIKEFNEAEYWYKEALKIKPDHIPAHLTYAKLLAKWNRYEEAEQWFLKAKYLAPNDSSVYQHYGQFLSEMERHEEAADTYVIAAELAPDDFEIVFNAANTLRQAGRNAEAEEYYHKAVKLKPHESTSHMNLGAMLHVNGKLMEAEASYLEALKLRPDDALTQSNLQKLRNLLRKAQLRYNREMRKKRENSY